MRVWIRRLLKGFVYVIGALLVAELFYRFFWKDPPMTEVVRGNHPIFHHVPSHFLNGNLGHTDYRERPYRVEKEPGVLRIAFIGDSFTYSFTSPDQTIPQHLRNLIAKERPDLKVEILNFGFVSYSPLIEEVVYRRLIRPLKPDIVIQLVDTFDPQDDVLYAKMATFDDDGAPIAVAGEEFLRTGWRRSSLVRFVQVAIDVVKNDWNYLPFEQRFKARIQYLTAPDEFRWVLDYHFSVVDRLAKLIENDGAQFRLFQYPPPHMMRDLKEFRDFMAGWGVGRRFKPPERSRFADMMMAFCKEKKHACFDFGPEVRRMEEELGQKGSRLEIYNNRDGHFTGKANQRFARFIFDRLQGLEAGETP